MFRETADSKNQYSGDQHLKSFLTTGLNEFFAIWIKQGINAFSPIVRLTLAFFSFSRQRKFTFVRTKSKIDIDGLLFCNAEDQIKMH
jgi:hypothetical protein